MEKVTVKELLEQFERHPPADMAPCERLYDIFKRLFLDHSVQDGLVDLLSLSLAGDGTPVYTAARERKKLQRMIPKATPKMLSQQLHDLEECGMLHREVIPDKPLRTLYSLTPFGRSIIPVLDVMCDWGAGFLDGLDIQPPCCTKKSAGEP